MKERIANSMVNINRAGHDARHIAIKDQALRLGFSKVGIARVDNLAAEYERLQVWLGRGYHGEMKWMERDPAQRADPRRFWPQARSVIVVALNYYTDHQREALFRTESDSDRIKDTDKGNQITSKISRYAWGDDYHDIVGDQLRELLSWIKTQWPEAEGKVCVDIQPVMDKAWAARAGLGWIGKHTNLITNEFGSWVFIGELLLNLDLESDEIEVADQCGSCTLCLDACPTHALIEPYVLDANLCISHATIESRAPEIRADVAEHLEGWLYGCDICQDVCPWNQMPTETNEPRFEPREGNVNASLSDIFELTPETYAERFRDSAMKRARLDGLQRNAEALINH
ncbi:MAG TPA: tRNA epoxyqueuosine(34) reductase QueG [Pyrinomonadaceae bacterium]|nr:tRNA epoxyqueuosine(34) reductase QueG [Pyrinomonadaceae bacterium]